MGLTSCPACATPTKEGAKFCGQCGAAVWIGCPACGTEATLGQRYCDECGKLLPSRDRPGLAGSPAAQGPLVAGTHPFNLATPSAPLAMHSASLGAASAFIADRRVITVLFTDVSGFTAMSEKLDPERVSEIMNAFFDVLVEPIYRYGGVVDKFIGDAIMALFGAPVAHEDDPARAVRAAWDMQTAARKFGSDLEARTGLSLRIRIGLNTGLVVAAPLGARRRADYTVLGDTVNLAQRMEANAKPGKVLVTGETWRYTRHACAYEALEPIKVKGRSAPVPVYELAGMLTQTALFGSAHDTFVGRFDELGELGKIWRGVREGRSHVVRVAGDKGVGKTWLVGQLIRMVGTAGTRVLRVRCLSFQVDSPYSLVGGLLRKLADLKQGAAPGAVAQILQDRLPAWHERPDAALAALLPVLGAESGPVAEAPPQQQTEAFLVINDIIWNLAAASPLIVSIEDLQWADEASVAWVESLLGRIAAEGADRPLLLLVQARKDPLQKLLPPGGGVASTRLDIAPLAPDDAIDLAASVLGATAEGLNRAVMAVLEQVLERAAGNPFFISEMVQALVDGGRLRRTGASWSVEGDHDEVALPPSISAAILARLDRLPADVRMVVHVAAVIGRRMPRSLLERVAGPDARSALETLGNLQILETVGPEVVFSHGMVQEVAYDNLLHAQRRELHLLVAHALEEAGPDEPGHVASLVFHSERGEDVARAARYRLVLGRRLAEARAFEDSRSSYHAALTWLDKADGLDRLPDRHEILLGLAGTETALGHLEAAVELLADAEPGTAMAVALNIARGAVLERRGDVASALVSYERAAAAAGDDRAARGRALAAVANVRRKIGDFDAALAVAREALEVLDGLDRHSDEGAARGVMGICLLRKGDYEGSLGQHSRALALRELANDSEGQASSRNNLGTVEKELGRWQAARQHYAAALDLYRRLGNRLFLGMVLTNLGDLLLDQGEDVLAERHFLEALRLARELGATIDELVALANLAEVHIVRGEGREALMKVDSCLGISTATGTSEFSAHLRWVRGRALALSGDRDSGEAELTSARLLAQARGNEPFVGIVDRSLAKLALAAGDREGALEIARRSVEALRGAGQPLQYARSIALLARLVPDDQADPLLAEALSIYRQLGARRDEEVALTSSLLYR